MARRFNRNRRAVSGVPKAQWSQNFVPSAGYDLSNAAGFIQVMFASTCIAETKLYGYGHQPGDTVFVIAQGELGVDEGPMIMTVDSGPPPVDGMKIVIPATMTGIVGNDARRFAPTVVRVAVVA